MALASKIRRLILRRAPTAGLSVLAHQRAHAVLGDLISKLRSQRTYCDLLKNAVLSEALNGQSSSAKGDDGLGDRRRVPSSR
jgi:hypothetical protein